MEETILELEQIISKYGPQLALLSEDEFVVKPSPDTWSKKEILGHLVDSVQNNIRRFVVAQYEEAPHIIYAQNFWVTAAAYQTYYTTDLVALWLLLNKHACRLLQNIPEVVGKRQCSTGELHAVEWLAADYNKHLLHHLHQILNLDPLPYP